MEERKILIATKTYPSISQKYRETVCTAGVLLNDEEKPIQWIRIYPIRYRNLDFDKRYPRWSIISAKIEKNDKDYREESYRINDHSIKIIRKIGTEDNWRERKDFLFALPFKSIKELRHENKSLGLIKPKIIQTSYIEEKKNREWTPKQKSVSDQMDLFEPPVELEKIPYKFGYKFLEEDGTSHRYSISDWEICQLYRNCRDKSTFSTDEEREKEAIKKVQEQLDDFLSKKDLYFIVGNLKDHKNTFMIIGLVYPKKIESEQLKLF